MQQVAVLFARTDSVYKGLPGCDVYDIERDARTYAPELSMGLQTAEEANDGVYDAPEGSVRTIVEMQQPVDLSNAPEALPPAAPKPAPAADAGLTYADLAAQIKQATDREVAFLVLDTARHLSGAEQNDLDQLIADQFGA